MENKMLDANLLALIIKDILATEEYDLKGIAYYTKCHEDVLHEVVTGCNINPSAMLVRNIIELHRSVRAELYIKIIK
jgi:hypothetical protein